MGFVIELLTLLVPHLPGLVTVAAGAVVGEGAKKVAFAAVPAGVKAVWERLRPKVEADVMAKASAEAVAAQPEDEDSIAMLKLALKKVLEGIEKSDPEMLKQLKDLMVKAEAEAVANTIVNVNGTDNQALVNVTAKNVVAKVEGGANFH